MYGLIKTNHPIKLYTIHIVVYFVPFYNLFLSVTYFICICTAIEFVYLMFVAYIMQIFSHVGLAVTAGIILDPGI